MRLRGSGTATALLAAGLMGGMGSWLYLCLGTVFAHSPAAKISAVERLPPDAAHRTPGYTGSERIQSLLQGPNSEP